jgi:hypothetical protein
VIQHKTTPLRLLHIHLFISIFFSDEFTLCAFSLEIVFFILFSATEKSYAKENLLKAIHLREARDFIYF